MCVYAQSKYGTCSQCGVYGKFNLAKRLNVSGTFMYFHRCESCQPRGPTIQPKEMWLSKQWVREHLVDPKTVPDVEGEQPIPTCAVCGCPGAEYHHWAPQAIFEDADKWPVSYLCRTCHRKWHDTMADKR